MKKIVLFHTMFITFLLVSFITNNLDQVNEIGFINNIFLGLITISYVIANIVIHPEKQKSKK